MIVFQQLSGKLGRQRALAWKRVEEGEREVEVDVERDEDDDDTDSTIIRIIESLDGTSDAKRARRQQQQQARVREQQTRFSSVQSNSAEPTNRDVRQPTPLASSGFGFNQFPF